MAPSLSTELTYFFSTTAICFGIASVAAYVGSSSGIGTTLPPLFRVAGLSFTIQWLFYLIHGSGLILGNSPTEMLYDISGAITFTCCTAYSVYSAGGVDKLSQRQKILNLSVIVWCFRLGSFLFTRILGDGHDSRFDKVRNRFFAFWNFWTIQGLWVFLTALSVFISNDSVGHQKPLESIDYVGIGMWVVGFLFEATADHQKRLFRQNPKNKGKFIRTGLWAISRHPNYFGEILLWLGVFILSINGFDRPGQWIAGISPVFVAFLLINISGIPLLEKAANKRWAEDQDYQNYKKNVPVLIPFVGRKGDAPF